MEIPKFIFVIQICFVIAYAEVCEDVDSLACDRLFSKDPTICEDPCLSKVCKRKCSQCPLKCYSCNEVSDPQTCTTEQTCPTKDHSCAAVKSYTSDFRSVYKLGCAPNSICQQQSSMACCTEDLCNQNISSVVTSRDVPSPVIKRQTAGACADVDELACSILDKVKPDLCSEDCIARSLCPRLCGKCYQCYECDHVTKTENCNNTRVCDVGHVCYTVETLNFNLEHGFNVGCVHHQTCDRLATEAANIFGRRDTSLQLSLNGGCCHGDLCNIHKVEPTTTTTMAPTTTHVCRYSGCPNGYHRDGRTCYKYGTTKMTWDDAKTDCQRTCGHLAEFSGPDELSSALIHAYLFTQHRNDVYFVGGQDPTHTNHWIWTDSGRSISSSLISLHGSSVGSYCAGASLSLRYELAKVPCTTKRLALCQATYRDN